MEPSQAGRSTQPAALYQIYPHQEDIILPLQLQVQAAKLSPVAEMSEAGLHHALCWTWKTSFGTRH